MTNFTERGAETVRMPEGNGYAITTYDEERPDRIVRHVHLIAVANDDSETELHHHSEVIWRAAHVV